MRYYYTGDYDTKWHVASINMDSSASSIVALSFYNDEYIATLKDNIKEGIVCSLLLLMNSYHFRCIII